MLMRVVGYVRERPGDPDGSTAYAQSEQIRRWVRESGHALVAVCRDTPGPNDPAERSGYRALLGIVRSGTADAVIIEGLAVLSTDKVVQEVILHDLRTTEATLITIDETDAETLRTAGSDHTRILVRDVLAKADRYRDEFGDVPPRAEPLPTSVVDIREPSDVVIELIPATAADQMDESADQAARPTA